MALALHRTGDKFYGECEFFVAWSLHFIDIHVVKTDTHNELYIHEFATQWNETLPLCTATQNCATRRTVAKIFVWVIFPTCKSGKLSFMVLLVTEQLTNNLSNINNNVMWASIIDYTYNRHQHTGVEHQRELPINYLLGNVLHNINTVETRLTVALITATFLLRSFLYYIYLLYFLYSASICHARISAIETVLLLLS